MLKYEQRKHGLYAVVYDNITGDYIGEVLQVPFKVKMRSKYNLRIAELYMCIVHIIGKIRVDGYLIDYIENLLMRKTAKHMKCFKEILSSSYGFTEEQALNHVRKMMLGE